MEILCEVTLPLSPENEELAKSCALGGQYWIEEDGEADPPSTSQRLRDLEEALDMILTGVTE